MKKNSGLKLLGLFGLVVAVLIVWLVYSNKGGDFGFIPSPQTLAVIGSKSGTVLTTVSFNDGNPTTTTTLRPGNSVDSANLNICATASTTATIVSWRYGFSDDGTNFFGEDTNAVSGSVITHEAATTTHEWTPGITERACKDVFVDNLNTDFFRVEFSNNDDVDYILYAELVPFEGDGR